MVDLTKHASAVWPLEEVERLYALYTGGMTKRDELVKVMGRPKLSIMAKLSRLGLLSYKISAGGGRPREGAAAVPAPPARVPAVVAPKPVPVEPDALRGQAPPPVTAYPANILSRIGIGAGYARTCQMVTGQSGLMRTYCGKPSTRKSWCDACAKIVFTPSSDNARTIARMERYGR